ncbi:hypothetical protein GHT09_017882 [Marmota monax]|uniref:Alpha-defensin N-terminal domain-containing protein n=2 Tax=Marmota monax TaxID=9995 RepID=A0A834Q596_MARMO|nr:hypothetical protein GHT09_017882 [Marmota monax]
MQPAPRSTHTQAPASSPPVTPAMRTLALLAALLLLALQAQAEPLPENNEEAPDHRDNEEDQDMAISFAGPEAPGLQRAAPGSISSREAGVGRRRAVAGKEEQPGAHPARRSLPAFPCIGGNVFPIYTNILNPHTDCSLLSPPPGCFRVLSQGLPQLQAHQALGGGRALHLRKGGLEQRPQVPGSGPAWPQLPAALWKTPDLCHRVHHTGPPGRCPVRAPESSPDSTQYFPRDPGAQDWR